MTTALEPNVASMRRAQPFLSSLLSKHSNDSDEEEEEEEEQTVLTSPLSQSSLSPDNPVYLPLSREDSDPSMIPTMDSSSMTTTNTMHHREERPQSLQHHHRKPSTISDLPPPGFFQSSRASSSLSSSHAAAPQPQQPQQQLFLVTRLLKRVTHWVSSDKPWGASWIGFWALGMVTCANSMLTPLRDAVALQVGVQHMPALTLASTALAIVSSVPIGWLFEAPDPQRRKLWKHMGLTRGETQGSSLALFYRFFAISLFMAAMGVEYQHGYASTVQQQEQQQQVALPKVMLIVFFLVVHLMKLHSLSLIWGVTTEAMEYEELAKARRGSVEKPKTRLQLLGFVGFGGTMGGILGSVLASTTAHSLRLSGLLLVSCLLLEWSAQLSVELGRIMQVHWEEERKHPSATNLSLLDTSMKRSQSTDSMKRVASGNSLHATMMRSKSQDGLLLQQQQQQSNNKLQQAQLQQQQQQQEEEMNDNSFTQRLMRGVTTILRSRLLMAIFTYNALFASTSVLLSFQRAELVVNRSNHTGSATDDTAFLANINIVSSVAVLVLQWSGMGPYLAHTCGPRGTLAVIPVLRLLGVAGLVWWQIVSDGQAPNLLLFLLLDECTKVINFAVAKPVRESLWRGLSNEARYEAKPIVDTLANRWGGGSAAFLVSLLHRAVSKWSYFHTTSGVVSPNTMLCLVLVVWWAAVSADLGHVRTRIDLELSKKNA